tara:strand:+ start:2533 stop:3204 length:672 start_codon:yes stop_codon:yes gene_type:complete
MKEINLDCNVKKKDNFSLDEGSFSLNNIFSVPILTIKVRDWGNKGKYLMKSYLNQFESGEIYVRGKELLTSYRNDRDMEDPKELDAWVKENDKFCENIEDVFEDELSLIYDKIVKPFDPLSLRKLGVDSAWFQNQNNGTSHNIHTHGSVGLSAVCYVKYNQKYHSPTVFVSSIFNSITNTNVEWEPKDCTEGTLIVFPSNILHYTRPNTSDISRVILSFNLMG